MCTNPCVLTSAETNICYAMMNIFYTGLCYDTGTYYGDVIDWRLVVEKQTTT